jgi:DNA (cytosine-5)-methyltransferase 1
LVSVSRPLLLDLFCGAGGAAMGYHRAGFDVVGVDIKPQPHYPFEFIQSDALEYLRWIVAQPFPLVAAIHASPPCQAHTSLKGMWNAKEHLDLIPETRELLQASGLPYVIENVPGAPMSALITLCGSSFGLGIPGAQLRRHRLFEPSPGLFLMSPPCQHSGPVIGVYGGHGRDRRRTVNTQNFSVEQRREAMGIEWMNGTELSQAIPPAYTQFIGEQLIQALECAA